MDWKGENFFGLKLSWEYEKEYVDVSMPNYIRDILLQFSHKQPKSPQRHPHEHTPIKYRQKTQQYALQPDTSEK